ncbi:hypothetical protein EV641_11526 [Rhodococcus sp. SMB37]|uniref:hypothetical protein n=1 Tax=Rhodococcus sp. SMB37 TaxID=2512213 RepID=UPI0010D90E00|nr:hypothetical protein [Rhodococcus sp. SMB37]TCN49426.1 hypothetical protein EV641_11526 [Rhodococcus sp. SMB37]
MSVTPIRDRCGAVDLSAAADRAREWHAHGATVVVFRPTAFDITSDRVQSLLDWMVGLEEDRP